VTPAEIDLRPPVSLWDGCVLLLTMLEKSVGRVTFTGWLQRPNSNLSGRTPVDLMRADRWVMLADFLDDILTGSNT
jgi:hypothetical protein